MTNEKINEMWTKLNETKLTGMKAANMLKKVLTKEENAAYTKEALEYMKAHPECLESPRKFDNAMNSMLLKYAESHKATDAKKLMAKIATFVEKIAEENGLEMPEFVFKTTNGKMNKHTIELNAVYFLYQNAMTEEETFKFYAKEIVRIFCKLYGIEINADIENYWNDEEENNDEVENNDEIEEEIEVENDGEQNLQKNQERTRIELVNPKIVSVKDDAIEVRVDGIIQNGKKYCDAATVVTGEFIAIAITNKYIFDKDLNKVALNYAVGRFAFNKGIEHVAKGLGRKISEIEDIYEQMRDIDGGEKMWDLRIENNMETLINMSSMLDCIDELRKA